MIVKVIRSINRGGFGVVEEVKVGSKRLARKTFSPDPAMKLSKEQLEKARSRFAREARLQAAILHPNIMPILDSDLLADPPWLLMPLASKDYSVQIQEDRQIGAVALDGLLQILAGLEEIHRLGYVHRDLKPQNVLWVKNAWLLSDFGLVLPPAETTTTLTTTGNWAGTLPYLPPEQFNEFHRVGPTADIFAFGCLLHDLAGTDHRTPMTRCSGPVPLGWIIERCTEPDPDERFQSVAALRSAIVAALSNPRTGAASGAVKSWIDDLVHEPEEVDKNEWLDILRFLEREGDSEEASLILRAIDVPQIEAAHDLGSSVFSRLAMRISRWARDSGFEWSFCDVLAVRLSRLYDLGGVHEKAEATMAALELGGSHNRWAVMRLFMRLAGTAIDEDLADRLVIEVHASDKAALNRVEQIENQIGTTRRALHAKVCAAIDEIEARYA